MNRFLLNVIILICVFGILYITATFLPTLSYIKSVSLNGQPLVINQLNLQPWKFLLKNEHWVFVHFLLPFLTYIFSESILFSIVIFYLNETIEASLAQVDHVYVILYNNSTQSYFTRWINESLMDSLLGDPTNGIIGILFGYYIMRMYFKDVKMVIIMYRKRMFLSFAIFFIASILPHITAGINIEYLVDDIRYYYPIGFIYYPFAMLIVFELLWLLIIPILSRELSDERIMDFILMIIFVFLCMYISTCSLKLPTYFCVWFGVFVTFSLLNLIFEKNHQNLKKF